MQTTSHGAPLIDVHAHFLTDRYVEEATRHGHATPDGMPWWPTWDVDEHLALMDRTGIDRAVLSISSPGVHFGDDDAAVTLARHVNDAAAEICRRHPDRFSFFASLPTPLVDASVAEAERTARELGAVGVAMLTNSHGAYPGDPAFDDLWAGLDDLGSTVFLHPTSPPNWEATSLGLPRPMIEFGFDATRALVGLMTSGTLHRHPRTEVVATHSGAALPSLVDRATMFHQIMRAMLPDGDPGHDVPDVARSMERLWFDCAGTPAPTALRHLTEKVGTDRIVYGSDFCFTPAFGVEAQVAALDSGATGIPDLRRVMADNAARLFAE